MKIYKRVSEGYKITKMSLKHFGSARPVELAGSTAYFAIFSMIPIIIIIISVFGNIVGDTVVRDKLFEELNLIVGQENTRLLANAIENYEITENSRIGTIIGVAFFLFSATTLFSMMQRSVNYIWHVRSRTNLRMSLLNLLKTRFLSFGVILIMGSVLLISFIIDGIIVFFKDFLSSQFNNELIILAQMTNILFSLAVVATVFAFIYRFMPDVNVKWSASWFGAIFTSILFSAGRLVINVIVGKSNFGDVYGTASSFVVILIWIYFTSLILYFGVEMTRQFSKFYNHENVPANFAVPFEIKKLQE